MLSLVAEGRTVAMQCCLRSGRDVFFFRVGHDAELNTYGPGTLVIVEAVEHLGALDVDLIDSGASPGNEFFSKLFPERRKLTTVVIGTGGTIDRTAVRALSVFAASQKTIKRHRS
jgi:CelD/BcsL family acetyltransferase involved in cellulose biosynthesis